MTQTCAAARRMSGTQRRCAGAGGKASGPSLGDGERAASIAHLPDLNKKHEHTQHKSGGHIADEIQFGGAMCGRLPTKPETKNLGLVCRASSSVAGRGVRASASGRAGERADGDRHTTHALTHGAIVHTRGLCSHTYTQSRPLAVSDVLLRAS